MNTAIRRLIHEQVSADSQIAGMLASYRGTPAFFYQKSPSDSRSGWGDIRYPRVDFNLDTRQDPERRTAGTLSINIWCTTDCPAMGNLDPDRAIEQRLLDLISGTFYTAPDRTAICAEWERTDEFAYEGGSNTQDNTSPEIYGLTMLFELMEFPEQISVTPDPIQGLNAWTKQYFPRMTAVSYDAMLPVWKPTDENPAIYWRFESAASIDRQSYAVTWYDGQFAAHVIADSVTERNRWLKAILERAQLEGEIVLSDGSPMFLKKLEVRHGADPLREGQLILIGQYGVLAQHRKESAQIRLLHPDYKMAKEEESHMAEAAYPISELAAKARPLFGTTPEIVTTALKVAGKESASLEEAQKIVRAFLDKEVN